MTVGGPGDYDAMTPRYGPHRWSAGYHDDGTNETFHGATFEVKDLAGARFVDEDHRVQRRIEPRHALEAEIEQDASVVRVVLDNKENRVAVVDHGPFAHAAG